ncbi:unnamed protein product (mitochondrion) [Plasmodiophora brassicae]|uniref:Uncharacterized protein n=1 Tax=Plasmodiophora brassicae TaxID=37360 RepID=A0A3P3Y1W4_PLABS|nr:unnamed protein product [Plasmodiophora brassicae]
METVDLTAASSDSDDRPIAPGPAKLAAPKRLGSFQTRGTFLTKCVGRVVHGTWLEFPMRAKKAGVEHARKKASGPPLPLGHHPRNRLEVGKLDLASSRLLLPLLKSGLIEISACVVFPPANISTFTSVDVVVHVWALPALFESKVANDDRGDDDDIEQDPVKAPIFPLLRLLAGANIADALKPTRAQVERSALRLASLYDSIDTEHRTLPEAEPPASLRCQLRPYQKQALEWMLRRENREMLPIGQLGPEWETRTFPDDGLRYYANSSTTVLTLQRPESRPVSCGGILGDEMGMGKTIEAIALMCSKPGVKPPGCTGYLAATLVVCPMSLLAQWRDEIERHSDLVVSIYYGSDRNDDRRDNFDVLITTYGVLASGYNQAKREESIIFTSTWDRVILDEAHHIKNRTTLTAKAAFALHARARFALTGTPIQNNLHDLHSLFRFLREDPWSRISWWNSQIQNPFEQGDTAVLQRLGTILQPLLLRRCKTSKDANGKPLLNLPPRDERVVKIVLSPEERALYDALFLRSREQLQGLLRSKALSKQCANVLEMIMRLRQACSHPFLVRGYSSDAEKQQASSASRLIRTLTKADDGTCSKEYIEELSTALKASADENALECPMCLDPPADPVFSRCGHIMCRDCSDSLFGKSSRAACPICRTIIYRSQLLSGVAPVCDIDLDQEWTHSAKTRQLVAELEAFRAADPSCKTVVFSQWTSMLDLVEKALAAGNHRFLRLDGKLSQRNREAVLEEFCNPDTEARVLLCSLRVGGVGLNLVTASNVILLDIWWNPAVDAQAIDRVHRIGQLKNVNVRRFVVARSIEERILELQNKKLAIAQGVLHHDDYDDNDLSERLHDLMGLFEDFDQ